ncbi:MAG: BatA and WFA domain-containing protein [Gemmatimonadaceae bacterium]|nr:BatA and WFA domain-containing protein [Gemmatimonadaceae bacterium]
MSFLQPLFLLLGVGAAVPLVLHLMRRRIHMRVDFPAVQYLARAERENIRQIRMRNLLLMVLRMLVVLLLALAAARPLGAFFGTSHVPTAMAIVLDNSLSTSAVVNGQPLLATLRAAARDAAQAATSSDRLWLVTADGQVVGGSRETVLAAIDKTDALAGRGDLATAVTRASGLVAGAGLGAQQVVVVTDGQATAWDAPVTVGGVSVSVLAAAPAAPANHAVVQAEARPARWTPGGSVVARTLGADSATYRIALGATRLASGTARAGEELTVHSSPRTQGWSAGVVELEPDELRGDDARHFAVWVGAAPLVRIDASAGAFARTAFDALVQSQRVAAGADVVIAAADVVDRLPALLIAPSDPRRVGTANRALERLGVPWRFGAGRRDETLARGERFEGVKVTSRMPLIAQSGAVADTLATAGGDAWVVAGEGYVLIGSPLDPSATDLPLRAGFVPWLGDIVAQRLAGETTALVEAAPAGPLRLPSGVTAVEASDGTSQPVAAMHAAPARPGVYFLMRGSQRVGALVVNPEGEESDLRRLAPAALRDRLQGRSVAVTSDVAQWRRSLFASGSRRPLQVPLIVLALLLLAAETFVVRRTEQQAGA